MRLRALLLTSALILPCTAFADDVAPPTGAYVGIAAGWDSQNNLHAKYFNNGDVYARVHFGADDSFIVAPSVGYRFVYPAPIRVEGEFNYTHHDISNSTAGAGYDGHTAITGGMVNLLYDIPLRNNFGVSLGGGIGIADGNAKIALPGGGLYLHQDRTSAQWQIIGEVNYTIAPKLQLFATYRFRGLQGGGKATDLYTQTGIVSSPTEKITLGNWRDHAIMAGLRFYFGQPPASEAPVAEPPKAAPQPPLATPPSLPPPPPPPPMTHFVVYFDFAKADLTDEARATIADAVKTSQENGFVKISVSGNTDTMGTNTLNKPLSLRRAKAVKEEMMRLGLTADSIAITGNSFEKLKINTGPNVREQKNRRAEIDLTK